MHRFVRESLLRATPARTWDWHMAPTAFARLTPPWQRVEVLANGGVAEGSVADLRLHLGPLRLRWRARHDQVQPGASFRDVQERGPFSAWSHVHSFLPDGEGCLMRDAIEWSPACWMPAAAVERDLARVFAWRHRRVAEDLVRHAAAGLPPLRIALSGSGGLVGSALAAFLAGGGHTVVPIVRGGGAGIAWDGGAGFDAAALRGCDAVVHLAGAGIADARWSDARRRVLHDSRVVGTAALARILAEDPGRVRTLVAASATGFYGDRGEAELDERSPAGGGFLAGLCRAWEDATDPCRDRVRVVNLRIGVVLTAAGGALARLLPPARLGLAGPLGHGRQWWPWIARDDLVHAVLHALAQPALTGPVNAVTASARQAELARAVAAVLGRPALGPPAPAAALRLALGGMVDEVLLASAQVRPARLAASGFAWSQGTLDTALRQELGQVST